MQHGGPEVVDGGWVLDDAAAKVVGGSPGGGLLDTCAEHPDGVGVGVVIATEGTFLMGGHATEFGSPEDESVFEKTTGGKVGDKAGGGLVEDGQVALVIGLESLVGVPVEQAVDAGGTGGAIELNITNPAFDKAAGEQTVFSVSGGERVGAVCTIEVERGF